MKKNNLILPATLTFLSVGVVFYFRTEILWNLKKLFGPKIKVSENAQVAMFPFDVPGTVEQQAALKKINEKYKYKLIEARRMISDILTPEQQEAANVASRKASQEGRPAKDFDRIMEQAAKITKQQKQLIMTAQRELTLLQGKMNDEIYELLTPEQKKLIEERRRSAALNKPKTTVQSGALKPMKR